MAIVNDISCGIDRRSQKADGNFVGINNMPIGYGSTPLIIALIVGRHDVAHALIAAGADLNVCDETFGRTALHAACVSGYLPIINTLLSSAINAKDNRSETPLHISVAHNQYDMAKALIALGVEVDAADIYGRTPLYNAARHRCEPMLRMLVSEGANVGMATDDGDTALHNACFLCAEGALGPLLDNGADVDAIDERGRTPLHNAARTTVYSAHITKKLLAEGADRQAKDADGYRPHQLRRC